MYIGTGTSNCGPEIPKVVVENCKSLVDVGPPLPKPHPAVGRPMPWLPEPTHHYSRINRDPSAISETNNARSQHQTSSFPSLSGAFVLHGFIRVYGGGIGDWHVLMC